MALRVLPVVTGFAVVGVLAMSLSQAGSIMADAEAEDGVITGNAAAGDGEGASNGASVKFQMGSGGAGTRDPLKQPFSSNSIWNMPIGSGAVYVDAHLDDVPAGDEWTPMPSIDDEHIILKATAPVVDLRHSDAGWGGDRCQADGEVLAQVPIPTNYTLPSSNTNAGASFLMPDGRTILQSQPFARCSAGGFATSLLTFDEVDLYGQGITGAHGGSELSSIGGSIRIGELRPGQQGPRHAVKINVDAKAALYECTGSRENCYRWPAQKSDSYAVGTYGANGHNQNTAMKMGVLLAIPASVDINSLGLQSEPGRQLAWTLQNYGGYVVDDGFEPGIGLSVENGPDGSLHDQFEDDYGMPLAARIRDQTPWSKDMQKIMAALYAVNNNSPTSVGGGGTPRQPLAPPIAP